MMRRIIVTFILLIAAANATAGELIINGGFETGDFGPAWVHGAFRGNNFNPNQADHAVVLDLPASGSYSALLGFKYASQRSGTRAFAYQDVTIPADVSSAMLFFRVRMQGYDSQFYDPFLADVRTTSGSVLDRVLLLSFTEYNYIFKDSGWLDDDDTLPVGYDMSAYAGQTVRIYFEQANLYDNLYETWTFVDDVSVVFRKYVDLSVDGNGNDQFGAVGTGDGGLSARSGVAGDTLQYNLTVENEGIDNDTYQLSANLPAGWTATIDGSSFPFTTASFVAGQSRNYVVRVVTPAAAAAGIHDVVVDAVSTTQGSRFDSVTLRAQLSTANVAMDAVIDGNGVGVLGLEGAGGFALKPAPWDSVVTYTIDVFNEGNLPTAFDVSMSPNVALTADLEYLGTIYTGSFTTQVIAAGGSASMVLRQSLASPAPGGDYRTVVRAVAVVDTVQNDSVRGVLRVRAPRVDAIVLTSGDNVYDGTSSGLGGTSSNAGERGALVPFPITIQNEASIADSFVVRWVSPGNGWNAVWEVNGVDRTFPYTTVTLPPFSQVDYVLKVTVPGGAAYGTYPSLINIESLTDSRVTESVTASVSVASQSEIDMAINGDGFDVNGPVGTGLGGSATGTLTPGDSLTFSVQLTNPFGQNAFDLTWNTPSGWTVTLNDQLSPILGVSAGVYQLKVVVPATSLGGTFDIIVDGVKSNKPFIMDSITGRVIVIPPTVVDGLIDGNGDDVFGAAGNGLGGASSQATSAPRLLNYTVELQNQGPTADSYTILWNNIPGWVATFAGQSAPFSSGPISAGGTGVYTFAVQVPAAAATGLHTYIIDVFSQSDSSTTESLSANINVFGPPRADLVIDGNGAGVFGAFGSGAGGISRRGAAPGTNISSVLRVANAGSFADSIWVDWSLPPGWPVGSVTVDDGATVHTSGFWTPVIAGGAGVNFAVGVSVPTGISSAATVVFDAVTSLPPASPESAALQVLPFAVVTGVVFDDRDRDSAWGSGDVGLPGVSVRLTSGERALTDGDGRYQLIVPHGSSFSVSESNPSGFVSLSPDTVGPFSVVAGDTVIADFADVRPLQLSSGLARTGLAGSYVDFPHQLVAGAPGQVTVSANNDAGAVTLFLLDVNQDGVHDPGDRALAASDLLLDPVVNNGTVHVLVRVFVPITMVVGQSVYVDVVAQQLLSPSSATLQVSATDAVVVAGSALGRVQLTKQADRATAAPGEVITYTVEFFNAGVDTLQNVVVYDPISPHVDVVVDGYGPNQDMAVFWPGAPGFFLTYQPDGDPCDFDPASRLLLIETSRLSPLYLLPGQRGQLQYRVRVR